MYQLNAVNELHIAGLVLSIMSEIETLVAYARYTIRPEDNAGATDERLQDPR